MEHAYIQIWPRFQEDENAGTPTGAIFPQREELKQQLEDFQNQMSDVSVDFGVETVEPHPESQNFKDDELATQGAPSDQNQPERQETEIEDKKEDKDEDEDDIPEDVDADSVEWI